ncbi:hypothetical protein ERJ75_001143400 [Trypanosoma vivax]|nr:hypothetical protein ERJ75_001143400 [Trypanosoma vivax]
MLATGVRLLTAVCVTLLACTSIETTPEGLPSGAAKMLCDFWRELMDAEDRGRGGEGSTDKGTAGERERGGRRGREGSSRRNKSRSRNGKGKSQEQHEGRNAEGTSTRTTTPSELDEAAEGAARRAARRGGALKQYITVLGALAGKKTCLEATGHDSQQRPRHLLEDKMRADVHR